MWAGNMMRDTKTLLSPKVEPLQNKITVFLLNDFSHFSSTELLARLNRTCIDISLHSVEL